MLRVASRFYSPRLGERASTVPASPAAAAASAAPAASTSASASSASSPAHSPGRATTAPAAVVLPGERSAPRGPRIVSATARGASLPAGMPPEMDEGTRAGAAAVAAAAMAAAAASGEAWARSTTGPEAGAGAGATTVRTHAM